GRTADQAGESRLCRLLRRARARRPGRRARPQGLEAAQHQRPAGPRGVAGRPAPRSPRHARIHGPHPDRGDEEVRAPPLGTIEETTKAGEEAQRVRNDAPPASLIEKLASAASPVVAGHVTPDVDALASMLAVSRCLPGGQARITLPA